MSIDLLLDWIIQTGLSVSILIAFVLIIRKPVARKLGAKAAYCLWTLPVIRLFLPSIPILPAKTPMVPSSVPPEFILKDAIMVLPVNSEQSISTVPLSWDVLLVTVWGLGALVWLAWQAFQQWRFVRDIKARTRPASPRIQMLLRQTMAKLDIQNTPQVKLSDDGSGPLVIGLMHPMVILPKSFETDFTIDQQIHALAHELSHLRNGDLWISALALVFRALNWPNPPVHLAAPQFRADQEAACDARVIAILGDDRSTRTAYADTLITAAKLSKNSAQPIPLGLTISNPLKERLMILKTNPTQRRSLRLALAGAAGLALLATAPLTSAQTPPATPVSPDVDVTVQSVDKQVMKWVTKENGIETKKHIEIITKDGETTAWEIDELGNRVQVPVDSLDMPMGMHGLHDGTTRIMVKRLGDEDTLTEAEIEVMVEEAMQSVDIEELAGGDGAHRIIVKRMGHGDEMDVDIEEIIAAHGGDGQKKIIMLESHGTIDVMGDSENSFVFHAGDMMKSKPGIMIDAASGMLDNIDTSDLDREARKKIEKAQKALREAQEALADTE